MALFVEGVIIDCRSTARGFCGVSASLHRQNGR